ncbi:MAG: hypothetical protein RQ751_09575 [Longimicrobiales bacterium]|nr:hypothetical protein [Longimicrobiales bacterium]
MVDAVHLVDRSGDPLFIAPNDVVVDSAQRVAFFGGPSASWQPDAETGEQHIPSKSGEYVGAILQRDGSVSLIESPRPDRTFSNLRATSIGEGAFHVFLAEVSHDASQSIPERTRALWFGTWKAGQWLDLIADSSEMARQIVAGGASDIVTIGDTVLVAAPKWGSDGYRGLSVIIFQGQRISVTSVPVESQPAYVDLAVDSSGELLLLVVQAVIRTEQGRLSDRNSMARYQRAPSGTWEQQQELVVDATLGNPVYWPDLWLHQGQPQVVWIEDDRSSVDLADGAVGVSPNLKSVLALPGAASHAHGVEGYTDLPMVLAVSEADGDKVLRFVSYSGLGVEAVSEYLTHSFFSDPLAAAPDAKTVIVVTDSISPDRRWAQTRLQKLQMMCQK